MAAKGKRSTDLGSIQELLSVTATHCARSGIFEERSRLDCGGDVVNECDRQLLALKIAGFNQFNHHSLEPR